MEFGNTHKRRKPTVQQPIVNETVTDNNDYISSLLPIISCVLILGIIYLLYKDLQKTKADMYLIDQNIKHILSIINKKEVIKAKPIKSEEKIIKSEEKNVKFEDDTISKVSLEDTDSEDDDDDVIELVAN
jgi:hypothetical protein|tara:strand:- start:478 stop:867 length:390 start_codon:yes stop_codon:yes gene_type:complete